MTTFIAQPRKGHPVLLDPSDTVGEAFADIARSCLNHLAHNEAVYVQTSGVEALHQLRVAARRLRSAFTLFGEVLRDDPVALDLRTRLRALALPFGAARDLDVFIENHFPQGADTPDASPVAYQRLLDLQHQAHAVVSDILATEEWREVMVELRGWLNEIEAGSGPLAEQLSEPAAGLAALSLDRFWRRVRRKGRNLKQLTQANQHLVRIEAKKLRYGSEFFARLFLDPDDAAAVEEHARFVAAIIDLQDELGALNDLATSEHIWLSVREPAPPGRAAHETELLERSDRAWRRLVKREPFWR